jgi:hypothetical protein
MKMKWHKEIELKTPNECSDNEHSADIEAESGLIRLAISETEYYDVDAIERLISGLQEAVKIAKMN